MNNKFNDIKGFTQIITMILIDLILMLWTIKIFFGLKDTIIAGIIGFLGAIIGGLITYIGVRRTLQHRDKEMFMMNVTNRMMLIDEFINKYQTSLNKIGMPEIFGIKINDGELIKIAKNLCEELSNDNEKIYSCLDYDAIKIISFHKKTLYSLALKKTLTIEEQVRLKTKVRGIFNVFLVSKQQLEEKYYEYKNMDK